MASPEFPSNIEPTKAFENLSIIYNNIDNVRSLRAETDGKIVKAGFFSRVFTTGDTNKLYDALRVSLTSIKSDLTRVEQDNINNPNTPKVSAYVASQYQISDSNFSYHDETTLQQMLVRLSLKDDLPDDVKNLAMEINHLIDPDQKTLPRSELLEKLAFYFTKINPKASAAERDQYISNIKGESYPKLLDRFDTYLKKEEFSLRESLLDIRETRAAEAIATLRQTQRSSSSSPPPAETIAGPSSSQPTSSSSEFVGPPSSSGQKKRIDKAREELNKVTEEQYKKLSELDFTEKVWSIEKGESPRNALGNNDLVVESRKYVNLQPEDIPFLTTKEKDLLKELGQSLQSAISRLPSNGPDIRLTPFFQELMRH